MTTSAMCDHGETDRLGEHEWVAWSGMPSIISDELIKDWLHIIHLCVRNITGTHWGFFFTWHKHPHGWTDYLLIIPGSSLTLEVLSILHLWIYFFTEEWASINCHDLALWLLLWYPNSTSSVWALHSCSLHTLLLEGSALSPLILLGQSVHCLYMFLPLYKPPVSHSPSARLSCVFCLPVLKTWHVISPATLSLAPLYRYYNIMYIIINDIIFVELLNLCIFTNWYDHNLD